MKFRYSERNRAIYYINGATRRLFIIVIIIAWESHTRSLSVCAVCSKQFTMNENDKENAKWFHWNGNGWMHRSNEHSFEFPF